MSWGPTPVPPRFALSSVAASQAQASAAWSGLVGRAHAALLAHGGGEKEKRRARIRFKRRTLRGPILGIPFLSRLAERRCSSVRRRWQARAGFRRRLLAGRRIGSRWACGGRGFPWSRRRRVAAAFCIALALCRKPAGRGRRWGRPARRENGVNPEIRWYRG
jgi:hypothetical protein